MVATLANPINTGSVFRIFRNRIAAFERLERRKRGSFGLSRAVGPLDNQRLKGVRPRKSALPTKKQERPRLIKFLQERPGPSWNIYAVGETFALLYATREPGTGV